MKLARLVHLFAPAGMATLVAGTLVVAPAGTAFAAGQNITATSGGTVNASALAGSGASSSSIPGAEISPAVFPSDAGAQHGTPSTSLPTEPPNPQGSSITMKTSAKGFDALDHRDQRLAGTGAYTNTQFSLEPPDQGLCVGNGYVVEPINTAMQVYNSAGTPLMAGPVALNQLFKLAPEVIRSSPPVFGDFTSDPKCLYDAATNRFFLTLLQLDVNPSTGNFGHHSKQLIAVTKSGNPTGEWNLFSFDTTDAEHPSCPCFGDQPLIGTDANGFYITTNEFAIHGAGFNGAQVYAMSKRKLAHGIAPTVVHIDVGETVPVPASDAGGLWYSLQPAVAARAGGSGDAARTSSEEGAGGTEYFLGALDFLSLLDNRVVVFTLSNTRSLNSSSPSLGLSHAIVHTETYGQPPPATQKDGSHPLGESLGHPTSQLNSNDDRMNQVVLADGKLWSGVNTVIGSGANARVGIAWFAVNPKAENGSSLDEESQGYVAMNNGNVLFPSIGVGNAGPIMTFTATGPELFPSAAIKRLNNDSPIEIVGAGAAVADGFTGYPEFYNPPQPPCCVERWGDYSAAVTAPDGTVWMATEYITPRPRTSLANWGTFVIHVTGEGSD
jgi:hypothetical protein